jgi:hypothetical protein
MHARLLLPGGWRVGFCYAASSVRMVCIGRCFWPACVRAMLVALFVDLCDVPVTCHTVKKKFWKVIQASEKFEL